MVSAICPDCKIALVEANSDSNADLAAAVDTAAKIPGVVAISNSYGSSEASGLATNHYDHPGIAITAASGDSGYGVLWPATVPTLTAVGGTTLNTASNARGWTETAWSGSGSGCSTKQTKPVWQKDAACARRTVADVAAVADPSTGVAIYDTYNNCQLGILCSVQLTSGIASGLTGWIQAGGTSVAAPVIASVYALAGNTANLTGASRAYAHPEGLNLVTAGSNGSCGGSYLCTSGATYSGPTGLGTPNGLSAF